MPQSGLSHLAATLRRLSGMPPREIAHRVRERVRSEAERRGLAEHAEAPRNFKSYLTSHAARRFYRGAVEPVGELARSAFPHWLERAVEEADQLCGHRVELLNLGPVGLGPEIDWHRDPVTGYIWPRRFWADYRLEGGPAGVDPKVIHELNRQQHLPRLAKAYRWTGDERYAAEAVAQLLGWIGQNPPGEGINWQSSLEIAIRCVSWIWALVLLLPSKALDEASAQRIGDSLFAQVDHVYRYTSRYSSPNTHLIGEAAALFIAGIVFQDQERCGSWLVAGAGLLQREASRQIFDDGVYGELSTYYHCYALDFYLQALILARQNGIGFSRATRTRLDSMLRFLMHVTRPDGSLPLLGDDDGGRALALHQRTYHSFRDALSSGAVLLGRGDFKQQSGEFAEETAWLLGPQSWNAYRCLRGEDPAQHSLYCANAGYSIERSGWGSSDNHLVFDCGGLGMLTGAHAHADSLSVVLYGGGRELLVDPGTFVYNGTPEWRSRFRSTPAHNTVSIDGRDQAAMEGSFHWTAKMGSHAERRTGNGVSYIEARHDGYGPDVTHRRRVLQTPHGYWILLDNFAGRDAHDLRFHFHFGPDVDSSTFEHRTALTEVWSEHARFSLAVCASAAVEPQLVDGWASSGYGEKHPAQALEILVSAALPASAMTFLSCTGVRPAVRQLEMAGRHSVGCSYEHGCFRDIAVLCEPDSEIEIEGFRVRGEFFWFSLRDGVLVKSLSIGAASPHHGDQNVLEEAPCAVFAAS